MADAHNYTFLHPNKIIKMCGIWNINKIFDFNLFWTDTKRFGTAIKSDKPQIFEIIEFLVEVTLPALMNFKSKANGSINVYGGLYNTKWLFYCLHLSIYL